MQIRNSSVVFCAIIVLLFLSCLKERESLYGTRQLFLQTKGDVKIDSSYFVSLDDVDKYISFRVASKGDLSVESITPVFTKGYPTSYIIQYSSYWEIISADKRGPIFLAKSVDGGTYDSEIPAGALALVDYLNEQIACRWEINMPFNLENNQEIDCLRFWEMLSNPQKVINVETKVIPPDSPIGQIVLISQTSVPVVYDSVHHLTTTRWSQGPPFNYACPLKTTGLDRVPAGCGAIAISQLLYYTHYHFGVPDTAPVSASCSDRIPNYSIEISPQRSVEIWDNMGDASDTAYNKAYILVAEVANKLQTEFTNTSGTSSFYDFPDVLQTYGIAGAYTDHLVADTLKRNLLNGLPVLMRGARTANDGEHGHFFLVDGYIRYREEITSVYRIVWTPPRPISMDDDWIEVSYTTPTIEFIKFNWGLGNSAYIDDSYSPYGTWLAESNPDGDWIYDHGYLMLSSFRPLLTQ